MLARAGTTTVLDMGGTGASLVDGIKRRGAGLNVAGLYALDSGLPCRRVSRRRWRHETSLLARCGRDALASRYLAAIIRSARRRLRT